jgi:uncharacterized protein YjbI with pentapeptide repeats
MNLIIISHKNMDESMPRYSPEEAQKEASNMNADAEQVQMLLRSVEEWNAWRKSNPEVAPNLRGAGFRETHLRGADLHGADLRGANLVDTDLREADLRGANLRTAHLRGADLHGADLEGADLRGVDFFEVDLGDAKTEGAQFSNP